MNEQKRFYVGKERVLFGRGYPSVGFIISLNQNNIKFLMGVSSFYEEVKEHKNKRQKH